MKKLLIAIIILGLAMYVAYLNIELKNTANKYEAMALETANRFEKVNEDAMKAREELARQILLTEEARAAADTVKVEAGKTLRVAETEAAAAVDEKPAELVKPVGAEQMATDPKSKADRTKAAAEALFEQAGGAAKNAWEEREAHL